jgi:hypothetical protein
VIDKIGLGVGVVALSLVAAGPVLAQQAQRVMLEGTFVGNPSQCVESEVQVFVRDNLRANRAASTGRLEANIFAFNFCEDRVLFSGRVRGNLRGGALVFDDQSNVSLTTAVQMVDRATRNAISMELDLTWVGGEQVVATTRSDIEERDRRVRLNRDITRVVAEAQASGTISIAGRNLFNGTTSDATIWTVR